MRLVATIALLILAVAAPVFAQDTSTVRNVLFISSYHPGFNTFDPQVDGIRAALSAHGLGTDTAELNVEFMDTKRFPGPENIASFRGRLAQKLAVGGSPDVVIVGDDNAFNFALSEQDGMFAARPIVFLGVNNVDAALAQDDNDRVTGVIEAPSVQETAAFALSLLREDGQLYAIVDNSRTGSLHLVSVEQTQVFQDNPDLVRVLSLEDYSFSELGEELQTVEQGSAVLLMSAYRDRTGAVERIEDAVSLIADNTSAPLLHPWSSSLGLGSLGGRIISHYEQGRIAGGMTADILNGVPIAQIPVVRESPNVFTFDYDVMDALGIDEAILPEGSIVLGAPEGLFETYGLWIIAGGVFLLLQTGGIVLLSWSNLRRTQAESALMLERQRFEEFADTSSDWLWEMGPDLRFTYLSSAFWDITGADPATVIGKSRHEVADSVLESEGWRNHLDDLENHRPFRGFVYSYRQSSGQNRWISVNGNPVLSEDGVFEGYRGTATEITEQRESEVLRDTALEEARRANDAKSRFLAMMSHEFRTPLNAILGFSDVMRNQLFGRIESENYVRYVNDIHLSGRHMLGLVEEILDLSAIEGQHRTMHPEVLDHSELFAECQRSVAQQAEESGVSLDLDMPIVEVVPLIADRRAMTQILLNLLSNAIKFTPEGGSVTLGVQVEDGAWLIYVRDTGIGIPEERLSSVTEPFRQGDQHPYTSNPGHGLGLAIVSALVAAQNGRFELESKVGTGTTARVILPCEPPSGSEDA